MTEAQSDVARDYYNSDDAELFYSTIWGGEDIHVGLYQSDGEAVEVASRRTVETLADRLPALGADDRIADLGSGYCGAARVLARKFGCHVVAVNIAEVENQRARQMNADVGLGERIEVLDGVFESLPIEDGSVAAAWSQDAILHSHDRAKVFAEVHRVLRPGGRFVFTDPMQADDCPEGVLDPILARIHLSSLGSPARYRELGEQAGLTFVEFDDRTEQLANHYGSILRETERREAGLLAAGVSSDYIARMKKGLGHWIDGGRAGHLSWGMFEFRKERG